MDLPDAPIAHEGFYLDHSQFRPTSQRSFLKRRQI
jgi:hypothetical protein